MQSLFNKVPQQPGATAAPAAEENYTLAGLNLITPDEIMTAGESPWTINSRMYARNDNEVRVASRTRMGAAFLSTPIGQTLDTENIASTSGDAPITLTFDTSNPPIATNLMLAQPWTTTGTGALTQLTLNIKKAAGAVGHIIVEIYTNNSGFPGTMIAQGAIFAQNITTSYQALSANFIDAPTLTASTEYWMLVYIQDNGSGTYYLEQTATAGALSTSNAGASWNTLGYSINFKTYLSTPGGIRGYFTYYPSNSANNAIIIAHRDKIWAVNKATGVSTMITSGLDDSELPVRFCQYNDVLMWANSVNPGMQWDGTTVKNIPGGITALGNPSDILIWNNRIFLVSSNNRIDFSDLLTTGDPTWPSVNFLYAGAPMSADHIAGCRVFQTKLVVFTHETKYVITGSDISTFTMTQAVGTKGATSQEAMDADRNYIYFLADDKQIYGFNGVADTLLSEVVQPRLQGISANAQPRIHVYRNQVRCYFPYNPSGFTDQCLIYDLELKQWFLDTGHPVAGSAELFLDEDELLEFSSLVGQVFYGESENSQSSDMGKKLDYKYWTNYKTYAWRRRSGQTLGGGSAKKRIKRFRPVVKIPDSIPFYMLVGKDMDFANNPDMRQYLVSGGGAVWGGFVWGDGTLWGGLGQIANRSGMSGRGNYIQFRFERHGVDTPVELYGYIALYKLGKQK